MLSITGIVQTGVDLIHEKHTAFGFGKHQRKAEHSPHAISGAANRHAFLDAAELHENTAGAIGQEIVPLVRCHGDALDSRLQDVQSMCD